MELKEIQDLIKFVAKSGVSEVELESKGFKIVIKTGNGNDAYRGETTVIHAAAPVAASGNAPHEWPVQPQISVQAASCHPEAKRREIRLPVARHLHLLVAPV